MLTILVKKGPCPENYCKHMHFSPIQIVFILTSTFTVILTAKLDTVADINRFELDIFLLENYLGD